jgi:hypothetical protein
MRTLILVGVAAGALLAADMAAAQGTVAKAAEAAEAAREAVGSATAKPAVDAAPLVTTPITPAPTVRKMAPVAPAPVIRAATPAPVEKAPDHGVTYAADDGAPVRTEVRREYRTMANGAPAGEWTCTYSSPDAREYRCTLDGTAAAGTPAMVHQAGPAPQWADADWEAEEEAHRRDLERACRPDKGLGGSVIGGLLGGFAGNRIAGRGNRTVGTLLGGALGAIGGRMIDQAEDRKACRAAVRRIEDRRAGWQAAGHGYGHGGGWYSPGYMIVTTTTPAAMETVEEITTTTHYETVPVARKRHAPRKRAYKPRPKPRCGC